MNNLAAETIKKYNLLQSGDRVVVALSGGADSVTLLDMLNSIKEQYNLTIYAAHLNHNLRGEEADRDESFCKILCKKYNIELFVKSIDIKLLSKKQKVSEELCGRNARYEFFDELSQKLGAKIATAHTASDNAETLLFNIARGTSVKGLSAIPPKRGNIIRPLIELTRTQIEEYCSNNNLDFVTDSTNLSDDYTRNSIRHNIIPKLKEINPRLEMSVMHLSENARELSEYINRQTEIALSDCKSDYGYSCEKLLLLDSVILKNALVTVCKSEAVIMPEYRHIRLLLDIIEKGGAVDLSDKVTAVSKQGVFRIVCSEIDECFEPVILAADIKFEHKNKIYSVTKINSSGENNNSVSYEYVSQNAVFRTRRQGDRFTYPKRKVTKPLRKVLNEQKIPSEIRDKLLVLAIDSTVLWCENIGVSLEGTINNSDKELLIEINQKMQYNRLQ